MWYSRMLGLHRASASVNRSKGHNDILTIPKGDSFIDLNADIYFWVYTLILLHTNQIYLLISLYISEICVYIKIQIDSKHLWSFFLTSCNCSMSCPCFFWKWIPVILSQALVCCVHRACHIILPKGTIWFLILMLKLLEQYIA